MKHTALPWKVFNLTDVFTDYEGALDGFHIADCQCHSPTTNEYGEMPLEEQKANAEFIARVCTSHYDLLEACKLVRKTYPNSPWIHEMVDKAIAKAEGKEK